jgi:hypothetical protein
MSSGGRQIFIDDHNSSDGHFKGGDFLNKSEVSSRNCDHQFGLVFAIFISFVIYLNPDVSRALSCPNGITQRYGHCGTVNPDNSFLPAFRLTPANLSYFEKNRSYAGDFDSFPDRIDWDAIPRPASIKKDKSGNSCSESDEACLSGQSPQSPQTSQTPQIRRTSASRPSSKSGDKKPTTKSSSGGSSDDDEKSGSKDDEKGGASKESDSSSAGTASCWSADSGQVKGKAMCDDNGEPSCWMKESQRQDGLPQC